jgi:hypothetical protein
MILSKPCLHPKPKRLPRKLDVTIGAGFICGDGILLAADTKESYGDTHTYVDKITIVDEAHCKAAIASSGEGYLLDYLTPHIEALLRNDEVITSSSFEIKLQALMARLYQTPEVKAYPVEKPADLYTQFLIVAKHTAEQTAENVRGQLNPGCSGATVRNCCHRMRPDEANGKRAWAGIGSKHSYCLRRCTLGSA